MSVPKPVIFSVKKKMKKNLFTTIEYTLYGLRSADGSREILPPEYGELYETGGFYYGGLRLFDGEGRPLVLHRFRKGMEGREVCAETTLAYCGSLGGAPKFRDGFAAVSTWDRGFPWHVIDTAGRVVLYHFDSEPVNWGNGFFSIRVGDACAVVDVHGRCVMRFPNPEPIADLTNDPIDDDSGFSHGEITLGEYKVRGNNAMEAFTQYLDRFKNECNLCLIATQNVEDYARDGRSFTYAFAQPPYSQACLYLDADIDNGSIFFSLRAPAAAPSPYQPGERLMLDEDRIRTMNVYGGNAFLPADIDLEALRSDYENEHPADAYDPSDEYSGRVLIS